MRKCLSLAIAVALACSGEKDPAPRVEITLPRGQVHVRDALTVQVIADDASSVELWRDGARLASLAPPYQYVWDTRAEAEGSHELVARAQGGGGAVESQPLTVVVDRTAPTVVSRFPDLGTEVAWTGDALRLRFSEPIAWSSIADGVFALSGPGAGAAGVTASRFGGQDELVLVPDAPLRRGEVWVHVAPGAITDLAGNAAALPDGGWSFTVPDVALLGGGTLLDLAATSRASDVDLTVRGDDVRAFGVGSGGGGARVLDRAYGPRGWLDGRTFVESAVGMRAATGGTSGETFALVQTDWNGTFELRRELAGSWTTLATFPASATLRREGGALAAMNGLAVLAWTEWPVDGNGVGGVRQVRAARWDGTTAVTMGAFLNTDPAISASEPSVALSSGLPMIAWTQAEADGSHVRLARWWLDRWELVTTPAGVDASQPCLAAGGSTWLAWRQRETSGWSIRAARYQGANPWDGQAVVVPGGGIAEAPSIAVDAWHRAAIAYREQTVDGGFALRVVTTPGLEWTLDPAPWSVARLMTPPRVGLGSAGEPVVAWTEGPDGDSVRAFVARANR